MSQHESGAEIRAGLDHPIIDADGHWIEYTPVFAEQIRKAAGARAEAGFARARSGCPICSASRSRSASSGWRR